MQEFDPALDPRIGRVGIEIQASDTPLEPGTDARTAARDGGRVHVVERHLATGLDGDLGDTGAHRPGADHADRAARSGHGQTGLIASNGWRQSVQ